MALIRRPLLGETWNRWKDYADHLEAEVERLRAALTELDEMHDDCTCRAGKKIIRRALGDG